jgi:hypothetical protein
MATDLLDGVRYSISCGAHTLQLCVKDGFNLVDRFKEVIKKGSKIVQRFNHSNLATSTLSEKQWQLCLNEQILIQNCPTRWNSTYNMCERLVSNRNAIVSVLADRSITKLNTVLKFEMSEHDWLTMDNIIKLLKSLQLATTALCSETGVTISLVLPIVHGIIINHLKNNDSDTAETNNFKRILKTSLMNRFTADSRFETVYHVASFLHPRSKDLSFLPNEMKDKIRISVCGMMEDVSVTGTVEYPNCVPSALDLIYEAANPSNNSISECQMYLSETQINHNLCLLLWWKTHENKYAGLAKLAKMYLGIPATSASSEREFSTAGNIATSKRSCLLPQNVNLLVFLYENKCLNKNNCLIENLLFYTKIKKL